MEMVAKTKRKPTTMFGTNTDVFDGEYGCHVHQTQNIPLTPFNPTYLILMRNKKKSAFNRIET